MTRLERAVDILSGIEGAIVVSYSDFFKSLHTIPWTGGIMVTSNSSNKTVTIESKNNPHKGDVSEKCQHCGIWVPLWIIDDGMCPPCHDMELDYLQERKEDKEEEYFPF